MDVVYFQGPQVSERELRWSLRSMAANLPHERVLFLGQAPDFVKNVASIDADWPEGKWHSIHAKNRALAKLDFEEATLFDDDMYVTRPVDRVPHYHTGWMRKRNVPRTDRYSTWREIVTITHEWLEAQGVEHPLHPAVHVPRIVTKENMEKLAGRDRMDHPILWRLAYGNLFHYDNMDLLPCDPKAMTEDQLKLVFSYDMDFLSSHNKTTHLMEDYLDGLFPDKCDYEV